MSSSLFAPTGGSAVKFEGSGSTFTGTITAAPTERIATDPSTGAERQTKAGKPVMEIMLSLQDQQGNDKTMYVAAWRQKQAISDAMVAAGARDIEPGGVLTVTLVGKEQGKGPMPANTWSAQYQAPGAAPQQAPQAPQQAYGQPAQAPQYGAPQQAPQYGAPQGYAQPAAPQHGDPNLAFDPNAAAYAQPQYGNAPY